MSKLNKTVTVDPISFLGLEVPVGTPIPLTKSELRDYKLNKNSAMTETCFAAIISHVLYGNLLPYPHNRGYGHYSTDTAKSIRNGIKWSQVGEMTYGLFGDSIHYGNDELKFHLNSFHSRTYGALLRHLDGNMSNSDYLEKISSRYSESFLETYISFGETHSVHTNNNKIGNANLAFGEHIRLIKLNLKPEIVSKIETKKSTVLSAILIALEYENNKKEVNWNWWKIYPLRAAASKRANKMAGEIKVTQTQRDLLTQAILAWNKFITDFEKLAGGVDVSKIINSAGIFGFFIVDYYTNQKSFNENAAAICVQEVVEVTSIARTLCRGNEEEMQEKVSRFKSILNMKLKKRKTKEVAAQVM